MFVLLNGVLLELIQILVSSAHIFFIDSAISVVFYNEELEKVVKRFMHNGLFEGK